MASRVHNLKQRIKKYERHIAAGSLIGGFVLDSLTLSRIDRLFENLTLAGYLLIVSICILLQQYLGQKKHKGSFADKLHLFLPFVTQFAFGGLFSGFTIFYSRSGSLAQSLPFILILVGMLVGTELFRKYYERLAFQITIFFLAAFLFSIFAVPIITGDMSPEMFLLSGVVSILFILMYVRLLQFVVPTQVRESRKYFWIGIILVYGAMNLLYFTNSIPPIPLSLKVGEVAHEVVRIEGGYLLTQDKDSLGWIPLRRDRIAASSDKIYVFSSIFAPTKIRADIVHHWKRYDTTTKNWVTIGRPSFAIIGGRGEGYRGYSYRTDIVPGMYRVDVETLRGQVIGRETFIVTAPTLTEVITEKTF